MSDYYIYFDESNKMEDRNKLYMFYGALGVDAKTKTDLETKLSAIFAQLNTRNELHFCKYTNDFEINKYLQSLDVALNRKMQFNIIAVMNRQAGQSASRFGVTLRDLKNMFYIKIPERLFYGLARFMPGDHVLQTTIIIDEAQEYHDILLNDKVRDQLNAQSIYRNLNFRITNVESRNSTGHLLIQITDCLLGIVAHLLEGSFSNSSKTATVKNELLYRLFSNGNNVHHLQEKIRIFIWDRELYQVPLSNYVSKFLLYKTQFDRTELMRVSRLLAEHPNRDFKFYRQEMGYSSAQNNLLRRYLQEADALLLPDCGESSYLCVE